MNERRMLELLTQVDDAYVLEASPCSAAGKRRRRRWRPVWIAAAILLLGVTTALAVGTRLDFAAWIAGALSDPDPAYLQEQLDEGQWVWLEGDSIAVIVPESPVQILLSDDGGESWRETVVDESAGMEFLGAWQEPMEYAGGYIGFNGRDGYLVLTSGAAMNHQALRIFLSGDGGETWRETGTPYSQHVSVLTGAGFASQEVGFISYRYYEDAGPDIWWTSDGGSTWAPLEVPLPEAYRDAGCRFTPRSPVFDGLEGTYPITVRTADESETTIAMYSDDGGLSWYFPPDETP